MPYTNVDILQEKGAKSISQNVWKSLNFMKKWVKKVTLTRTSISISGLSTKRLTFTLNDIIYYYFILEVCSAL
jgi:hypothetical protein